MAIFNVLCYYVSMDTESEIRERFKNIEWALDERLRRLYAASEAKVRCVPLFAQLFSCQLSGAGFKKTVTSSDKYFIV